MIIHLRQTLDREVLASQKKLETLCRGSRVVNIPLPEISLTVLTTHTLAELLQVVTKLPLRPNQELSTAKRIQHHCISPRGGSKLLLC